MKAATTILDKISTANLEHLAKKSLETGADLKLTAAIALGKI